MNKLSALLDLTVATKDLGGSLFDGFDLSIARLIIWGVHKNKTVQALTYCSSRGIELTEGELFAYAHIFRNMFRVDVDRITQPNCYFCSEKLVPQEEELCGCYLRSVAATYIQPDKALIDNIRLKHPNTWRKMLQSTYICINAECRRIQDVNLEVVAKKLDSGKPWTEPTRCQPCFREWLRTKTDSRSSSFPPKTRSDFPTRRSTIPPSLTLNLPATGES